MECIDLVDSSQEPDDYYCSGREGGVVDLDSSGSSSGSGNGSGAGRKDEADNSKADDASVRLSTLQAGWKRSLAAMGYSSQIAHSAVVYCDSLEAAVDFALNHSVEDDSPAIICTSSSGSSSWGSSSGGGSSSSSSSIDEALAKELQEKEELKAKVAALEGKLKTAQQGSTHSPRPRYWVSGGRGAKHAVMKKGVECIQLTEDSEEYQAVLSQFERSSSASAPTIRNIGSMDVTKIHRIECDTR
jgi:hypothetical protein